MTLYLNKPTYLHNSVHSSFSNLTKALEHQNESDAKTIDNYGSSLENHTFDSLKDLIEKPTSKLNFIFQEGKVGGKASGEGEEPELEPAGAPPPAGTAEPGVSTGTEGPAPPAAVPPLPAEAPASPPLPPVAEQNEAKLVDPPSPPSPCEAPAAPAAPMVTVAEEVPDTSIVSIAIPPSPPPPPV